MLRALPRRAVCAEIGVFEGDFSALILEMTAPTRLHLIDPWKHETDPEYAHAMYGGPRVRQADLDAIHDAVTARFDTEIKAGTVHVHRQRSAEALVTFDDDYFDWIYVDGNHRHEFVTNDLETGFRKVKAGGYVACDDYGIAGWWENGVTTAVHAFLPKHACRAVYVSGSQFVIQRMA